MNIALTLETVKMATDLLKSEFEGKRDKIQDCFQPSETATGKHILEKEYRVHMGHSIPKIFVYLAMDEIYGQCTVKDGNGDLGYKLKFQLPVKP